MPTASATGSVPGRRPCCWCPPNINGRSFVPRFATSTPTPFGPPNLCAEAVERRHAEVAKVHGHLADRLDRVAVKRDARRQRLRDLADRLNRTRLVVGEHDADETRVRMNRTKSHDAARIDRQPFDRDPARFELSQRLDDARVFEVGGDAGRT